MTTTGTTTTGMTATALWKVRRAGRRLASARRVDGWRGLGGETVRLGREVASVPVALGSEWVFDVRRGIRTRGFVRNEQVLRPVSIGGDPVFYQPIGLRLLRQIVPALPIDPGSTTFLDLGAGRGRAAILAAELGFRTVVGVELDADLAREAAENVRRWRARSAASPTPHQQVSVVHGDAAAQPLPDGPLLISMYNAFGPTTLRLVLTSLCSSRREGAAPVFFAYLNPVHAETFDDFPQLPLHVRGRNWAVYRLETGRRPS